MQEVPSSGRDSKCQCYISVSCHTASLHNKQNHDAILLKSRSGICRAMALIIWLLHYLASPVGTINYWPAGWAQNQISIEGTCCRRKFPSFQASSCLSNLGKICMSSVVHMVQKVSFSWENLLWKNTQKWSLSPSCSSSFFDSYTTRASATRKLNPSACRVSSACGLSCL